MERDSVQQQQVHHYIKDKKALICEFSRYQPLSSLAAVLSSLNLQPTKEWMNSGADLTAKFIKFKLMAASLPSYPYLIPLLLCLAIPAAAATTLAVTTDSKAINALTTYTFTISFHTTTPRSNLTLLFPAQLSLAAVTVLTLNSTITLNSSTNSSAFKVTTSNNSIWLNRTVSYSLVIAVVGVKNPPSVMQTMDFFIRTNDTNDNVTIPFTAVINYQGGTLDSCNYQFSGTTQQTNCTLNLSATLSNPLAAGTNTIYIGYPNPWENSKNKYLTYNSTLTCSFIAANRTGTGNCTVFATQLQMDFSTVVTIPGGSLLVVLVGGVNCPPTVTTLTSSVYTVTTKDAQRREVDRRSSCTISNTAMTTAAGVFNNLTVPVNAVYSGISIQFPAMAITFQDKDTFDIVYDVSMPCGVAMIVRASAFMSWTYITSPSTGICTYEANFTSNEDYNSNNKIYLASNMTAPPSAQPTTLYFLFKRNGSPFMNLTSVFASLALPLLNSSFSLALDSNTAVVSASYLFTLTLGQPIGAWGQVVLYLPNNINTSGITNSSCSGSIGSSSLSLYSCTTSQGSSSKLVIFSFAQTATIPKGSILTLSVRGLGNARVAFTPFSFGVETYYNRSQSLSRVEYNLLAAETTFTTYRSLSVTISPATFYVYDSLNATLYYKNEVILPSGVVFTYSFPSALLDLTFNPALVYANTTLLVVNETTVTTTGSRQLIFRINQEIPIGTNISVLFALKTPANLGTYNYINLTIIKDGNTYEECVGTMQLAVTKASAVDFTITPTGSTTAMSTGATTTYRFTMTTYIPHPPSFFVLMSLPPDTSYLYNYSGIASTCTGNCNSSVRTPNSTLLNITMINPNSSLKSFTFTLGFFVNPRSLGRGMPWNFSTYNVTGPQIGSGSAAVEITIASVLNASLPRNRRYFRSNTDPIELYISLANKLIAGDFILLQFGSDSYTAHTSSLTCTKAISCSATNQTTANVLVVEYRPSPNQLGLSQLTIFLDGLVSSPSTGYNEYKYFNLSTYTSSKLLIDQGYATYNISCGQVASSRCKECLGNGSCLSCYSDFNSRLFAGRCVNNCSTESYFQNYNANGSCELCGGGCATCTSATTCITCVNPANLQYYLYPENQTCLPACDLTNSYYSEKINAITYCKKCYSPLCLVCKDDGVSSCTKCSQGVLESGQCMTSCTLPNTFLFGGVCTACPVACRGCTANSVANCLACEYPYLNDSNICVLNCHAGSVANYSTQTCGCGGKCRTCEGDLNYCLTCVNSSQVAFQGVCQGGSCPNYSYNSNGTCKRCTPGCFTCPAGICTECDNTTFSFESKCYTDCNSVSTQYDNDNATKKCVLCPNGCDRCEGVTCLSCLSGFSLSSTSCVSDCMLMGNCKPEVPEKILPMPGTLTVVVWIALVVIVKLLLKKLYAPYSLMLGVCLAQFGLILASLAVVGQSQGISRLLLGNDYSYRLSIRNLLLVGLLFNYICNFLYLIVFYKYIRPMITLPRQIDYIAHAAVLVVGTLTNYRFSLITFSRMFPKPHIEVDNSSRITPINYLAVSSVLLDLITLAAAGLLIYKEYPGTNLFMLGMDLLVVLVLAAAITVWMVAVPKSEEYYLSDIRKFSMEDNYRTEEDINHEKSQSYAKLVSAAYNQDASLPDINPNPVPNEYPIDQKTLILMASSQEDNPPLPVIAKSANPKVDQVRLSQASAAEEAEIDIDEVIHFEKDRVGEVNTKKEGKKAKQVPNSSAEEKSIVKVVMDEAKTKRISSTLFNPTVKDNSSPSKGEEQLLQRKKREQPKNFSKERVKKLQPLTEGNGDLILVRSTQQQQQKQQQDSLPLPRRVTNDTPINLVRSKHRPRRSEHNISVNKLPNKQSKVFQTQKSEESHTDEVDLQAIIDNKIKQSQAFDRGLKIDRRKDPTEDISPSWFNSQNQRVDAPQVQQIE